MGRDYSGFGQTAEDLDLILRIASRPQAKGLTPVFRYLTARYLSTIVDAGSGPGWWLAPRPVDMTDRQKLVMAAARPGSLMEWLLVVMAASDTPGAVSWANGGGWDGKTVRQSGSTMGRLRDFVYGRYRTTSGDDWLVARLLVDQGFRDETAGLGRDIKYCRTSASQYAAFVVGIYEGLAVAGVNPNVAALEALPPGMQSWAKAHLVQVAALALATGRLVEPAGKLLDWLAGHSPSVEFSTWLNVARTWNAGSVVDLVAVNAGVPLDSRTMDALNLLGLDDLVTFAEGPRAEGDQRVRLVAVIAARAFVLGRLDVARRYLQQLGHVAPIYAPGIAAALAGPGGAEVQVAWALLRLPEPSVWLQMGPWWQAGGWGRSSYVKAGDGGRFTTSTCRCALSLPG